MKTYIISRANEWSSAEEWEAIGKISAQIGNAEISDNVRWILSYVTRHDGGRVGTVCIYQATSPEALREHARRVGVPADAIIEVTDTVIVQPDLSLASSFE